MKRKEQETKRRITCSFELPVLFRITCSLMTDEKPRYNRCYFNYIYCNGAFRLLIQK